jgi:hypothetical protein
MVKAVNIKLMHLKSHLKYDFFISIRKELIKKIILYIKNKRFFIEYYNLKAVILQQEYLILDYRQVKKGNDYY